MDILNVHLVLKLGDYMCIFVFWGFFCPYSLNMSL